MTRVQVAVFCQPGGIVGICAVEQDHFGILAARPSGAFELLCFHRVGVGEVPCFGGWLECRGVCQGTAGQTINIIQQLVMGGSLALE